MSPERRQYWQLSPKITISMLAAVLLQAAGMLWWASALNAQVVQNTKDLERHEVVDRGDLEALGKFDVRLARIEERLDEIRSRLPAPKALGPAR